MRLSRGTVSIDVQQCKGCELCIPVCHPAVLVMSSEHNRSGYRYPELLPGCTACRACFDVCPDFVFDVYRFDEPVDESDGLVLAASSAAPSAPESEAGP